jgi:hypothetical protein
LVISISNSPDYGSLADWLESTQSVSPMTGDYHDWAEQWAIDSVKQARNAYQNLAFQAATIDGQRLRITVALRSSYADTNRRIVAEQLEKAGFRLAQLLNSIQWR